MTTIDRAHQATAGLMAVMVLVLAVMAGQSTRIGLGGSWDIEVHGYVGNTVFLLALVNGGLALKRRQGELLALVIGLLVFAQIGLGYVGRETLEAAQWHVPNGVLLMGLTTYQLATVRGRSIEQV